MDSCVQELCLPVSKVLPRSSCLPKNFKSQIRLGEFVAYPDQAGIW